MELMRATIAGIVVALLLRIPAFAGDVGVALLGKSDFDHWMSSGTLPIGSSQHISQCQDAKFNQCSECATLIVSNHSNSPIKVKTLLTGSAFSESSIGARFIFGGNRKELVYSPCGSVAPGGSCFTPFEFCPQQSGVSRGQLSVDFVDSTSLGTIVYTLVGKADYAPALAAADKVRKRHLRELMKIPKVVRVSLAQVNSRVLINIEVQSDEDGVGPSPYVQLAQRLAPTQLDGYAVEVTEYVPPVGHGF